MDFSLKTQFTYRRVF